MNWLTAHWLEVTLGVLTAIGLVTPPESKVGTFARALAFDLANKNAKKLPADALERLAAQMTEKANASDGAK